jgi:hypothetical protein
VVRLSQLLISVRGWVNPRIIVQLEELCQWKFPVTFSRIETATYRLVVRCPNQLRQRALPQGWLASSNIRNNFMPNHVSNQFILIAANAHFISNSNVSYGILNRRAAHQSSAVKYILPRLSICTFIILLSFYSRWLIERNNWTSIRLKFEKYLQSTYFWLRPVTNVKL